MKKIILALLACGSVGGLLAQQYTYTTQTYTNTVAALSTNIIAGTTISLTKYEDVGIEVRFALTAAGTGNSQFKFAQSVDGTNWESLPTIHTKTIASTGTTAVRNVSTINAGAVGYLRLASVGNADDDGVLTNIVVIYTTKAQRFGR